ncbi:glycosyltransferase [Candidatus Thiosymbion oneisti]|uniref:glycosyltransferase n=1 Tax=Candidatus Thiosymbion oneisti TaxID=589554 RepID=UPI00105E5415|nr:glycosyltransferase family 4 protein [Candidatus Thiosymbion oneisti]
MTDSLNPSASRVMLVTKKLQDFPVGGREQLCKLNYSALMEIFGDRLVVYELPGNKLQANVIRKIFSGHIDGLNNEVIGEAQKKIKEEGIGIIFVDGSNLGEFVKVTKRNFPEISVSTFFHNVEARFFLGALRHSKTLHALAVLIANYLAERKAVRYSDKIICMTNRDSSLLQRLYGRPATHLSALAIRDQLPPGSGITTRVPHGRYALFVGGAFYANRAGISWFVRHVVPHIRIKTCIVGKGFEKLKHELGHAAKVEVVGVVDSLAEWYRDAHFVIAPIFDGSGMKTKVAEALMHGKKIIGTPDAFSGYEDVVEHAGQVCTTADEFIAAIGSAKDEIVSSFDPELRMLYEEKYSYPAARSRLAGILCSVE